MTDTPRRWDRLTAESDPAFEAFAAYLDTGSLRDAYRQRSGKAQATAAPVSPHGMESRTRPAGTPCRDQDMALSDLPPRLKDD